MTGFSAHGSAGEVEPSDGVHHDPGASAVPPTKLKKKQRSGRVRTWSEFIGLEGRPRDREAAWKRKHRELFNFARVNMIECL